MPNYLTYNDEYWATDIEGDLIPSTKVHCLCAVNIHTGEEIVKTGQDIVTWLNEKTQAGAVFVGHNFIGYDAPTLNRLLGTRLSLGKIVDTMVLSMIYSPSLDGGHSLEAWGDRLRFPKGKFTDFSALTDEMLEYCLQDARLTRKVFLELLRRMNRDGFSEVGLEIEHRAWSLVKKQQIDGFAFDIKRAHELLALLRQEEDILRDRIRILWPAELLVVASYKRPFKKDGTPSVNYARHLEEYERVQVSADGGEYHCHAFVHFNIGSPAQRTQKLLDLGWIPREFTEAGHPQATVKGKLSPSLEEFVESGEAGEGPRLIARWIDLNARGNMVNTWIEAYDERTGCIHGTLWVANTLRYRHSAPNTANIPAVRLDKEDRPLRGRSGVWTYEARDLWTVRSSDRLLVGVDAKGIQLRVLAHYLNNPGFTESVLAGDPHSYNQSIGGFPSRAIAKTFIYAFLLGAGDAKVGQIIGGSQRDGKEIKSRFINNFPGLSDLLGKLQGQIDKTGRIILCDGTPLLVTAPHTRLGYLLQGDESRIMKKAAILVSTEIRRRKLDVIKVGDIHDEWQNDTLAVHCSEFTEDVLPPAFKSSGEFFNYRLPIGCSTKIGRTWAETH